LVELQRPRIDGVSIVVLRVLILIQITYGIPGGEIRTKSIWLDWHSNLAQAFTSGNALGQASALMEAVIHRELLPNLQNLQEPLTTRASNILKLNALQLKPCQVFPAHFGTPASVWAVDEAETALVGQLCVVWSVGYFGGWASDPGSIQAPEERETLMTELPKDTAKQFGEALGRAPRNPFKEAKAREAAAEAERKRQKEPRTYR
jgi:hypothetical protein